MTEHVPIVNYLALDGANPHLRATVCEDCDARYLEERRICAHCSSSHFRIKPLPRTGRVGAFSIIHRAAPGVATPFVSAIIDLDDGTSVKTNIVGCPPDPEHVQLGMRVEMVTFDAGTDSAGTVAIAFGFTPASEEVP